MDNHLNEKLVILREIADCMSFQEHNKLKSGIVRYAKYLLLAALLYTPIFSHLDSLPIRIWDEGRNAVSALEMFLNGNYLIPHFNGTPDMWSTKPPLLIWLQLGFMQLVGINELAVRLPSAIAALLTCVALLLFSLRYLKSFWFGFIAIMVLVTTDGYIAFHVSRTGDYDSLLVLFTTLSGLLFFAFIETKKQSFLYLFFLFSAFAVLTKSVTGLLFVPALIIYCALEKQLLPLLRNRHFYFGLFSFLLLVSVYYLTREYYNPGYLEAVNANEWSGRYFSVLDEHKHSFLFYYDHLISSQLSAWYLLLPCGMLVGWFNKEVKLRRITIFSCLMMLTFLLIISSAQTKLFWYSAPLFPWIALLIAVFLFYIFKALNQMEFANKTLVVNTLPFIFLFIILVKPYQSIVDKTYFPEEPEEKFYELGAYLKKSLEGKYDV
jgi:4-amino-4-deoxy-L-arabinose transferase-like glycosyltransferase